MARAGMKRILFVCLGNICRSPAAEGVFRAKARERGINLYADSAGTGGWHVGDPAHRGTQAVLRRNGITYNGRARQVQPAELHRYDYVIAMDADNVSDLRRMDRRGALDGKLHQLLAFAPDGYPRDVPDPYYNGKFDAVYELVDAGVAGLLDTIRAEHNLP